MTGEMKIAFKTSKLQKRCNRFKEASRAWGFDNARILNRRLQEIDAVENLEEFVHLPGPKCHPLVGHRNGQWACSLAGLWRLIFVPDGDPASYLKDGKVVTTLVSQIKVVEIEDYHG